MYNYEGESPTKAILKYFYVYCILQIGFFEIDIQRAPDHTVLVIKLDKSFHKWVLELLVSNFCRLISKFTSGWLINDDTTREDSQIVKGSVQQIVLMSLSKF